MDFTALTNAANNVAAAAANLATAISALIDARNAEQAQIDDLAGKVSLANESIVGSVLSLNGMLQVRESVPV
jgi:hypothetical protein